jgi:tetratricopeptide (TPR) repeat protein
MKTILTVVFSLVALIAAETRADSIYSLIMNGSLQEAGNQLSQLTTAALRDGDVLFLQSLVEPDAAKSAQLMEAALSSSVSTSYRQEIYLRLAQYYLIKNDFDQLSRVVNEYRASWESGRYEDEMLRLSLIVDQMTGDYESALRQADRFLVRYAAGEEAQWGKIDKARILKANDKAIGAVNLLRQLLREKKGVGVPQALYLLALDAIAEKRTEDAVFYYNLLREGYPEAVGLDALIDKLSGMAQEYGDDSAAEQVTGTFYTVKVGVFSEKDNAERQAGIFKEHDKHVKIGKKSISGKQYHVVYVGKFQSYQEAFRFKTTLESSYGEVFQVVAQ